MNKELSVKESVHQIVRERLVGSLKSESKHINELTKLCNSLEQELSDKNLIISDLTENLNKSVALLEKVINETTK